MTRFVLAVALILGLLMSCVSARAAALWDVNLTNTFASDQPFTLLGQFSTPDALVMHGTGEPILTFTGTLNGQGFTLLPLDSTPLYVYDNRFYGPTDLAHGWTTEDAFDPSGVVLNVGGVDINVYSDGLLIALYPDGDSLALSGTVLFDSLSSPVGEPATIFLLALGVALLRTLTSTRLMWGKQ